MAAKIRGTTFGRCRGRAVSVICGYFVCAISHGSFDFSWTIVFDSDDVSDKCSRCASKRFPPRTRGEFLTGPPGTRGTLFGYPQPARHTSARDVLLTQTSATMSAMTTQAHAARPAAKAPRVTVRPRARPRARRRSSRTSFAQRLGLRTGKPTSSRAPRARAFCGRDAASSLVTHRRTIPRLCVAFAPLCHIAGERALHACARCRAPPRVATDPIPRRSPGAGPCLLYTSPSPRD